MFRCLSCNAYFRAKSTSRSFLRRFFRRRDTQRHTETRRDTTRWRKNKAVLRARLTDTYNRKFAALSEAALQIVYYFLSSFLSVPRQVQDMAVHLCSTALVGYALLVHVELYVIYPVLVAVPTLLVCAIVHFFYKTSAQPHSTGGSASPTYKHQQQQRHQHGFVHRNRRQSLRAGMQLLHKLRREDDEIIGDAHSLSLSLSLSLSQSSSALSDSDQEMCSEDDLSLSMSASGSASMSLSQSSQRLSADDEARKISRAEDDEHRLSSQQESSLGDD